MAKSKMSQNPCLFPNMKASNQWAVHPCSLHLIKYKRLDTILLVLEKFQRPLIVSQFLRQMRPRPLLSLKPTFRAAQTAIMMQNSSSFIFRYSCGRETEGNQAGRTGAFDHQESAKASLASQSSPQEKQSSQNSATNDLNLDTTVRLQLKSMLQGLSGCH